MAVTSAKLLSFKTSKTLKEPINLVLILVPTNLRRLERRIITIWMPAPCGSLELFAVITKMEELQRVYRGLMDIFPVEGRGFFCQIPWTDGSDRLSPSGCAKVLKQIFPGPGSDVLLARMDAENINQIVRHCPLVEKKGGKVVPLRRR